MRRHLIAILAGATLLAPAPAAAQSLAARIAAAPADQTVHFMFESKPGVCGDGEHIRVRGDGADGMMVRQGGREHSISSGRISGGDMRECIEGPVQIELTREDGRVTAARSRVGSAPRTDGVQLGDVPATAAVEYMLSTETLRDVSGKAADRLIFAATLADVETWPQLLRVARLQQLPGGARKTAVFWLAQAAGDKATEGLRSLVGDDSDEMEVRKSAVFALSQIRSESSIDTLIEIARTNSEPEIRKNAIFWLGQSGSPRAIAFFEEVLRG